ncbi:MAG: UDP-N-acetylmuramoyl-L-alanine--D-glutamate ligase [Limisphaerales bacterium]
MIEVADKRILVVGLGLSGRAATRLLASRGAKVTAVDTRSGLAVADLKDIQVKLGVNSVTNDGFDLVVISPGLSPDCELMRSVSGIRTIGEMELGWLCANRPSIAVTGTNGKTTTTQLIDHVLNTCGKKSLAVGNIGQPVSGVADEAASVDYLTIEASSFQLESVREFRPPIAVLTNITTDHMDRYAGMPEYAYAKANVFLYQQPDDTAIVQNEALAYLRTLDCDIPAQIVTYSASSRRADLHLDDDLIISSLPGWEGPLLAMQQTSLRGPHNAENVMATLAVGWKLGLPLETMIKAFKTFRAAPHRCELVGELNGVQFINDSKATNLDAMMKAIDSIPCVSAEPNVWLIAGGSDKGFEFHDAGPLLARRVKGAFLIGETSGRMKSAWNLFTNCQPTEDLEEAVQSAAQKAELGDVILLSPACASFDQFSSYEDRGNCFKEIVAGLLRTTYSALHCTTTTTSGDFTINTNTEHQP